MYSILSAFFQTTSWIVFAAAVFTFTMNKLSTSSPALLVPLPSQCHLQTPPARHRTQKTHQTRERTITSSYPFRLLDLPIELVLVILSHCAVSPSTYASLVRTSSVVRRLTYESCLPHIPIWLVSSKQVRSFDALLRSPKNGVKVTQLVRHLWLTPLHSKDLISSVNIVRMCKELESLATNAYVVKEGIVLASDKPTHDRCVDLTLLSTNTASWTFLLQSMGGVAFMAKLRRLRLIGDKVTLPKDLLLDNLSHFSYGTTQADAVLGYTPSFDAAEEMLGDRDMYPLLKYVIITKPTSMGGLRISLINSREQINPKGGKHIKKQHLWLIELPSSRTELEIWCDNALGRGLWQLCLGPYPSL